MSAYTKPKFLQSIIPAVLAAVATLGGSVVLAEHDAPHYVDCPAVLTRIEALYDKHPEGVIDITDPTLARCHINEYVASLRNARKVITPLPVPKPT